MVKITNISSSVIKLDVPKDIDGWKIPNMPEIKTTFKMTDTVAAFANAFRICSQEEIETNIMDVDINDTSNIQIGDSYILSDMLNLNLNLIPITQDIDDAEFELIAFNNTIHPLNVYSKDIKQVKGKTQVHFNKNIKIMCLLESNTGVKIRNIKIKKGFGKYYSSHNLVRCSYKTINKIGKPLESTYTDFEFEFISTCIDGNTLMLKTVNCIDKYCDMVLDVVVEKSGKKVSSENSTEYYFDDGAYMLGNLLRVYILKVDSTIELISVNIVHPEENTVSVHVVHKNPDDIMKKAVSMIKKDLTIVSKSFSK